MAHTDSSPVVDGGICHAHLRENRRVSQCLDGWRSKHEKNTREREDDAYDGVPHEVRDVRRA